MLLWVQSVCGQHFVLLALRLALSSSNTAREPAWHHRARLQRKRDRDLLRAYKGAYTPAVQEAQRRLDNHHGSDSGMATKTRPNDSWTCYACNSWTWNTKTKCHGCGKHRKSAETVQRGKSSGADTKSDDKLPVFPVQIIDGHPTVVMPKGRANRRRAKAFQRQLDAEQARFKTTDDAPEVDRSDASGLSVDELKSAISLAERAGQPKAAYEAALQALEAKNTKVETLETCRSKMQKAMAAVDKAVARQCRLEEELAEARGKAEACSQQVADLEALEKQLLQQRFDKLHGPQEKKSVLHIGDILGGKAPMFDFGEIFSADMGEITITPQDEIEISTRQKACTEVLQQAITEAFGSVAKKIEEATQSCLGAQA